MDNKEFGDRLQLLINEISGLPKEQQDKLTPLVTETKNRHEQIATDSKKLANKMTQLRICVKYILFDLEATRRERDQLLDNEKHDK